MRKTKKRSLRLTLLLLLLVTILLLGSSYAWFTANQIVTISAMEVNVAAQNGLQISADGSQWVALLNKDDMVAAATTYETLINQFPTNLAPVSTSGAVSAGKMDMFVGSVSANGSGFDELTAEKETEATGAVGNFIAFDMFLKVEQTTEIELTANSNVKAVGANSTGIENASRIAFVVEGTQAAGTSLPTIQGMSEGNNSTRYIWEPNYDIHTAAAVAHANSVYGITTTTTGAAQIAYDGVKAEIDTGILMANTNATANGTLFGSTPIAYKTPANFGVSPDGGVTPSTDSLQIFTLSPGITKIRVYMWIEGQDVDCENTASGANIAYNIQISRITNSGT